MLLNALGRCADSVLCLRLKKYFDRLADDLEVYSAHAKRKTIEVEDVELLMRRYLRCGNLSDPFLFPVSVNPHVDHVICSSPPLPF